ncbi:MAG: aldehyde dehydrogenase family protein [Deltaproteobacteria bacterium]|nr:aldehyde dehydrogenase family protein [Deltaproteobacteria bacterium]
MLTDLPPDSKILREEIFGAVLAVIRARNIEEATSSSSWNRESSRKTRCDGGFRRRYCCDRYATA